MKNDTLAIIDDLLLSWHRWADKWSPCAGHGSCAMFTGVKSSRQFDSEGDVADASLHNTQMKAVDFQISEMQEVYRTALQIAARNLSTGAAVWRSPRLPEDAQERGEIVMAAKVELVSRLGNA
jgi:hypothetical protein